MFIEEKESFYAKIIFSKFDKPNQANCTTVP